MNLVSVIIPTTKSELKMAYECEQSILESTYKNVEVLIINEGLERSAQRNLGIERAHGEYILYLDSDQKVSPYLIAECVQLMQFGYSGVFIPEIIVTKGWFGRLRNFERSFYDGTAIDCVRFFRRKCCPRFSTELHGPEDALHNSQIKGLKTVSESPLYHDDKIGLIQYLRKKAYYAKSMRKYAELNPTDKCLDIKYRCWTVFTEKGKYKKLLRHPIGAIGIFLLLIARGIIYYAKS